jgi:tRNA threonylcarbamoyladenosine biosynthesis protein TsaB
MRLLALDTSARACSAAVWCDGAFVEHAEPMVRGHAEALLPMILHVMRQADVQFSDLDALAVSVGPGAFTGLRVGIAAARGIALAAGLSCLGVSTLELFADGVDWVQVGSAKVLVTLDTKRDDFYTQLFAASRPLSTPAIESLSSLAATFSGDTLLLTGDASETVAAGLATADVDVEVLADSGSPLARRVAVLAAARWESGIRPQFPPSPAYLRSAAAAPPEKS